MNQSPLNQFTKTMRIGPDADLTAGFNVAWLPDDRVLRFAFTPGNNAAFESAIFDYPIPNQTALRTLLFALTPGISSLLAGIAADLAVGTGSVQNR